MHPRDPGSGLPDRPRRNMPFAAASKVSALSALTAPVEELRQRLVSPTEVTFGLFAGHSTCKELEVSSQPFSPGLEPPSPEETKTVTPFVARFCGDWILSWPE